ncbi:ergosterol biosynthesis ERG4/ERG24 [Mycena metata]|uniref:Delta(24(24(1)))-sterol reductase n=1 Tax=Mycena metata TaxID=1033252 RepID=A0AAD7JC73_9AGAR|nr:ergosterol biosynthesis ERG4/ERG24 [Mycena metata]
MVQNSTPKKMVVSDAGKEVDRRLDQHDQYEFGGPLGVTAIMLGFPTLMYYLWICLWFYDGQLVYPHSVDEVKPFLATMWTHVYEDANPSLYAWKVYGGNIIFQFILALVMPGYQQEGLPVPSLNYKTLMYNCNALYSLYATMITAAALHYTGLFRLTEILDNFGHLMSVAMICGFSISFGAYFFAVATGSQIRMSGNFIYDVFMGAILNPRIGSIDLKMWAEVRIPWVIVFFLAVSGGCKQYEELGYVTPCIPQTWDMYHEKWGFMVIFWNFAGVPFVSRFFRERKAADHLRKVIHLFYRIHGQARPSKYHFSTPRYVFMFATLLTAYYIFDTAMSQKSRFKMQTQGITTFRTAFPQLPWSIVKNPTYIQTAHGNRLLTSGWWAYSRKPNYAADWVQSFCWGAIIGNASPIPYFYSVFFITVLVHRVGRDFERCAIKYGKDWEEYCRVVKYKFVPGIY